MFYIFPDDFTDEPSEELIRSWILNPLCIGLKIGE